ncbi:DUF2523 domain-containing protein [Salmonella enterica]|nr:DUF2523 domain-containing protein [Salmonella enterica]ECZ5385810.1 DUF2523 domain-containing protein [Salmonella enterica subsp. enterica serovar Montevideo]EFS0969287.1 DUF2523 domain-containing protein [Salmonella enterica]
MFAIMIAVFNTVLEFLFSKVVIKFVVMGVLYVLITGVVGQISSHLPALDSVNEFLKKIPDPVWYYLNVFNFSQGVAILFPAWFTRFFIRRIPFFG